MSSSNTSPAVMPNYATFTKPHSNPASASHAADASSPLLANVDDVDEPSTRSATQAIVHSAKGHAKRNTGLLLIVGSQLFLSFMSVAVKKLNAIDPPISPLELVVVRMAITYICCILYVFYVGVQDPWLGPKGVRMLLVFRGLAGFCGLIGIYGSLQYLSLSDATVLSFLVPLCTAVSGSLFLGEHFTIKQVFAGIFSFAGVVLIARPAFLFGGAAHTTPDIPSLIPTKEVTPEQRLMAVGFSLIGVAGATSAYTLLRAIGKRAHALHSMMSFSAQCVIIASIALYTTGTPFVIPVRLDWLAMLLMVGFFGFIAQILLTMGLQRETASRGTMAIYTQVIFATVLERIFFGTTPSLLSIFGAFMIVSSALYVALTKETKKETPRVGKNRSEGDVLEEGMLESEIEEAGEDTLVNARDDYRRREGEGSR